MRHHTTCSTPANITLKYCLLQLKGKLKKEVMKMMRNKPRLASALLLLQEANPEETEVMDDTDSDTTDTNPPKNQDLHGFEQLIRSSPDTEGIFHSHNEADMMLNPDDLLDMLNPDDLFQAPDDVLRDSHPQLQS